LRSFPPDSQTAHASRSCRHLWPQMMWVKSV
jgi:hypothetical protein